MTFLDAIILGVVEGLTEFLPVSSTGHLILAGELLQIPTTEFVKSFDVAIQFGAILAVVALFFHRFLAVEVLKRLAVAFVPSGAIGFAVYPFVKGVLLESSLVVVAALALGGVAFIVFELLHRESESATPELEHISYGRAFGIGLFQSLAIIPGVSRSGATILGGLLLGLKRTTIVEFSFLLAVPTMLAATGYDMLKSAGTFSADSFLILGVGFVTSFLVALLAMKFLLSFVRTHSFIPFGIYRIIVAALFFLLVL